MRVQGGEVEVSAVLGAVFAVEDHAAGQLHGDERFAAAAQGAGGLEVRAAALIHQGVEQLAGGLVLDGLVLAADDTEDIEATVDGVGPDGGVEVRHRQGCWGGDAGVVDVGFLGNLQRHFADVPAGQVGCLEGLAGGHGVPHRLAEAVPGVTAGVGEGHLTVGDVEFVCHENCSFPGNGVGWRRSAPGCG